MFLRRQDVIDQFEANFRETAEGHVLFQPPSAEVGLPISWEDYAAVTAAFERTQTINMALGWAAMLAAGIYGYYHLIVEGRYIPFFVALGIASLFLFLLTLRNGLGLLLPFIQAREELEKAIMAEQSKAI